MIGNVGIFFENIRLFLEKYVIYLVLGIIGIIIIVLAVEKLVLRFLESRDIKKDYSNKSFSLNPREDTHRNEYYYGVDYWCWQKKKLEYLNTTYRLGVKLDDGKIVTNIHNFNKVVNKFFSSGKRHTRYKREFRVHAEYIPKNSITNYGDTVYGDKIGRDKIYNQGHIQYNEIDNTEVKKIIEYLIHHNQVNEQDKRELLVILNKLADRTYTQKEHKNLISILSEYTGIAANISTMVVYHLKCKREKELKNVDKTTKTDKSFLHEL